MIKKRIWETFPSLTRAVKHAHDRESATSGEDMFYGHDFDHALRVANYATLIAIDNRIGELAGAAALCHNADRLLQARTKVGAFGKVSEKAIKLIVTAWLDTEPINTFTKSERESILQAVLYHDRVNNNSDSDILITLKDADRLTNIDADIIIRDGQFLGNKTKVIDPYYLLSDPAASYKNPGSILRHLQEFLDWEKKGGFVGIRLPRARRIAKSRFKFLRLFLETTINQRQETGLIPYPKF